MWRKVFFKIQKNWKWTERNVTRLDGARGMKQVWSPHVRTWALLEANYLVDECSLHVTLLGLFGGTRSHFLPGSGSAPHCDSAPGNCAPCPSLITPCNGHVDIHGNSVVDPGVIIVQQTSCEPLFPDAQMQLKFCFFVPFVRPCMHHNYCVISKSLAGRYCVWPIILGAELYTTCRGERVLVVIRFNVTFLSLRPC